MRFSNTFSLYVIRNLLVNLFYVFIGFCFIGFILDLLELVRKVQGKEIFILQLIKISFYKVPFLTFEFLPFIFLFGSIITFTKLNNNSEIIAIKSAGISVWSICIPVIFSIILLSILSLWIYHPISAIFLDKNRILENRYFGYSSNRVSLQANGIWLYDKAENPNDEKIIMAKSMTQRGQFLSEVLVYYAGENRSFTTSYIADLATIENGFFLMMDVKKYTPGQEAIHYKELSLATNLIATQIQNSIPNPEIIPFWSLNDFIKQVKQAGLSTLKHELYYKSLLSSPLLYVSLVLIALACSINLPRSGKLGVVFIVGSLIGLIIFFVNKMVNVLALTAVLPVDIAVLAPSITYLLLSSAMLIHCEEG